MAKSPENRPPTKPVVESIPRRSRAFLVLFISALWFCLIGLGALVFAAYSRGLLPIDVANVPTDTPIPTLSPTPSPTAPSTATAEALVTATATRVAIVPTATATATPSPVNTPTPLSTPTPQSTRTLLPTNTPVPPPPTSTPTAQLSGQLAIPVCVSPCEDRNHRQIILVNVANPQTAKPQVLLKGAADPSFHPNGRQLVFRSVATSQAGRGEGIFVIDLASGKEVRVDGAPDDYHPVFLSRARVLFSSTRIEEEGRLQYRLFIISQYDLEDVPPSVGPNPSNVLKDARFPSVAPNGLIAFAGCVRGCGIWTTTEAGYSVNDACCALTMGGSDTAPDWSPDGTRVAFTSREEGNYEIYIVGANGAGRTRLTTAGGTNVAPTWSPDGRWIAYLSDRGGQWAVWLVRANRPGEVTKLFDLTDGVEDAFDRRMDWTVSP